MGNKIAQLEMVDLLGHLSSSEVHETIGKSFVMHGGGYGRWYRNHEARYLKENTDLGRAHIDAMARRETVKLFLSHLWHVWLVLEDIPVTLPKLSPQAAILSSHSLMRRRGQRFGLSRFSKSNGELVALNLLIIQSPFYRELSLEACFYCGERAQEPRSNFSYT